MNLKKRVIWVSLLGIVTLILAGSWNAMAGDGVIRRLNQDYERSRQWGSNLDWTPIGTWVVSVELPAGPMLLLESIQAQDLAGIHYGGIAKQVNVNPTHFGMFPEVDSGDETYLMQMIRTGPDSFEATQLTYGISLEEGAQAMTKIIVVVNTQWTMTGAGTAEGHGTAALYLAEQDADSDGFPDDGEVPTFCLAFPFSGKRLHVMPPCEPTSIPGSPLG